MSKVKNEQGEFLFKHLSELALNMLCYPEANASSERLWSKLNLEKTYLRSNLQFATLRAILLSCEYVKHQGGIHAFEPNDDMILRMALKYKDPTVECNKNSFSKSDVYHGININDEKLNKSIEKEDEFVRYSLKGQLKFEKSGFQCKNSIDDTIQALQPNDSSISSYSMPKNKSVSNLPKESLRDLKYFSSIPFHNDTFISLNDNDSIIMDTPEFVEFAKELKANKLKVDEQKVDERGFYPNGLRADPNYYHQKGKVHTTNNMYSQNDYAELIALAELAGINSSPGVFKVMIELLLLKVSPEDIYVLLRQISPLPSQRKRSSSISNRKPND
uniref:HAT C-terminal dimerisation domain-containing protein n=1 Tax=Trichogramma kaykai TaxID=54128 RepID=A0ABD2WY35_9HYME